MLHENPHSVKVNGAPPEIQHMESKRSAVRPIPLILFPLKLLRFNFVT